MFPKRWVAFIHFLVWMQHCMPALLAHHDCLRCCDSPFLIRLACIIVLNCLMKPLPRCILAFIFKANPIESFLFIQSATFSRFRYLKDYLRSCQSHRVVFDHEKVVVQAFRRWKLRAKGTLGATTSSPRSASDWRGFDEVDLWDWFLGLNVLWSHRGFWGCFHSLNGNQNKASWLQSRLNRWLAQGHRESTLWLDLVATFLLNTQTRINFTALSSLDWSLFSRARHSFALEPGLRQDLCVHSWLS